MLAIDLPVGSIEEGGGVKGPITFDAAHAILVERSRLRCDPLGLKDFPRASHASIWISFLALNLWWVLDKRYVFLGCVLDNKYVTFGVLNKK